jgi:uncharacterized membrane protein YwaF
MFAVPAGCMLGVMTKYDLYRLAEVLLIIVLLLAIYWYFRSDPDRRDRFKKDLKDALDRFGGGPPASA